MNYFLKRTAAYLIDCTICYAVVMLVIQWGILSFTREAIGITDEWLRLSLNLEAYVLLTISLPVWLYFTWMDSERTKGSIGKRVVGLAVRGRAEGGRISIGKSFTRTVLKLLPWEIAHLGVIFPTPMYFEEQPGIRILTLVGILLFAIYVISIFLSQKNQSLYDRLLATEVVQSKHEPN